MPPFKFLSFIIFNILIYSCKNSTGQQPPRVFLSENFSYSELSNETKEILQLWRPYLDSLIKNEKFNLDSSVWDTEIDPIGGIELYYHIKQSGEPINAEILNIQKLDSNKYSVKTAFYNLSESGRSKNSSLNCIYDIIIKKKGKAFKVYNFLSEYTEDWSRKQVGNIVYHYNPSYRFNQGKAKIMSEYCDSLANFFSTESPQIKYYIFKNSRETFYSMGFLYNRDMYDTYQIFGRADPNRNIVYCGNNSEIFPHEIVHLYTHKYYNTLHSFFDEGLAEYLDFSIQTEKISKRKLIANYLNNNPQINLSNILELDDRIGNGSSYKYDLSCLLVEKLLEKDPEQALHKILNGGTKNEDFYTIVTSILGIEKRELNNTIRGWLTNY